MRSHESSSSYEWRLLVLVGLSLWLVAAGAAVWEALALQSPDSPLHVGVLAGPVAQLASFAFALGTGELVVAALWPSLYTAPGHGRVVAILLALGGLLHTASLSYAAARGILAIQVLDPRDDVRMTLYLRLLAHGLTVSGVGALLVRVARALVNKPRA